MSHDSHNDDPHKKNSHPQQKDSFDRSSPDDHRESFPQGPTQTKEKLQVLTAKQIEAYKIPKDCLWYLKSEKETLGPFHQNHLKAYLDLHPEFPFETKVANAVEQKWWPLFKIPFFQRRQSNKPWEEKKWNEQQRFYLLLQGQKSGPFLLEHLEKKLAQKELLYTDLMSYDQGEHWIKITEHPHFDRRSRTKHFKLPNHVQNHIFETGQEELNLGIKKKSLQNQESEGLFGLAFLERHKLHQMGDPHHWKTLDHILSSEFSSSKTPSHGDGLFPSTHASSHETLSFSFYVSTLKKWFSFFREFLTSFPIPSSLESLLDSLRSPMAKWTYASLLFILTVVGSVVFFQRRYPLSPMANKEEQTPSQTQGRSPASMSRDEEEITPNSDIILRDKKNQKRRGKILYQEPSAP